MQSFDYPPGGVPPQKIHMKPKAAAAYFGCIAYGDYFVINFNKKTKGAYLSHDNPNAFEKDFPAGHFAYDGPDGVGTRLVSSPTAKSEQVVNFTFYDDDGTTVITFTLYVTNSTKCPPTASRSGSKSKKKK